MATKIISFRLSDEEIAVLQQQGQESESPSQTAQRVLRNALGVEMPRLQDVDAVDKLVDRLVDERISGLQAQINERIAELESRLGELVA